MLKALFGRLLIGIFVLVNIPLSIVFAENKIVLNEFSPHPSTGNKEWVEFYNPDGIDMASYWVDDDIDFLNDSGNSNKKILSTLIKTNPKLPYIELSSMLNNDSDLVVLFDNLGNVLDQYEYKTDSGEDVAVGRTPDGTGIFQTLAEATRGNSNSAPAPTQTPTPAPTATPTKEPTPTKTPTVLPTKIPTPLPSRSTISLKSTSKSGAESIEISAVPTSILGLSTAPTIKKNPPNKTLVESANQSKIPSLAIIAGSVFLLVCAIVLYVKVEKN